MPNQPTVYARHEATTDPVAIKYLDRKTLSTCKDVAIYHDRACHGFYATFPFFYVAVSSRRLRFEVTLNCFRYRLVWV